LYPTALTDPQFKALFKQEPINPYTGKSMLSNNSIESGIQYASDGTFYKLCIAQQDVDDVNNNGNTNEYVSVMFTRVSYTTTDNFVDFRRASIARMPDDTTVVATNMPRFVNNDGVLIEDTTVNKIVSEESGKTIGAIGTTGVIERTGRTKNSTTTLLSQLQYSRELRLIPPSYMITILIS